MREQHVLARLEAAKKGDDEARTEVALYVFNEYKGRLQRFHRRNGTTADPAITMDDLQVTFFEGIYRHVPLADERGNPLYHLGQRGIWNVMSELRVIEARMKHRLTVRSRGADGEFVDPIENEEDPAADFGDLVIERQMVQGRVRVLMGMDLKARERQAAEAILSGEVGSPDEPGFNKRLAAVMGVSAQRASQVVQSLRERAQA